jgi:hypothetical protein
MVFKLLEAAQKSWRRLEGHNQLPKLVLGGGEASRKATQTYRSCNGGKSWQQR